MRVHLVWYFPPRAITFMFPLLTLERGQILQVECTLWNIWSVKHSLPWYSIYSTEILVVSLSNGISIFLGHTGRFRKNKLFIQLPHVCIRQVNISPMQFLWTFLTMLYIFQCVFPWLWINQKRFWLSLRKTTDSRVFWPSLCVCAFFFFGGGSAF